MGNKGLITQNTLIQGAFAQDTELKLHIYFNDSTGQVAERLKILPYPRGVRNKGLITKNVNSTCIRAVFKIQSGNFTGTSKEQVVERFAILSYPGGVKNKGLITQKRKFDVHSHSFQDTELKLHRYVNVSTEEAVERLAILPYCVGEVCCPPCVGEVSSTSGAGRRYAVD